VVPADGTLPLLHLLLLKAPRSVADIAWFLPLGASQLLRYIPEV
jgi:hypothetical protein